MSSATSFPATAVFVGEGSLLIQCVDTYVASGNTVTLILTDNDQITEWAKTQGLPVHSKTDALTRADLPASTDFLFSVANLAILPEAMLSLPRRMAINFHDALLPADAGLHATSWALMAGKAEHGVTWHEMLAKLDAGRILAQERFPVGPGDTAFSLNARCYDAGARSFAAMLPGLLDGSLQPRPQQGERSYHGKHKRPAAACLIDWQQSAETGARLVHALHFGHYVNPLGRPKLLLPQGPCCVAAAVPLPPGGAAPGTVVRLDQEGLVLATAAGDLQLTGFTTLAGDRLAPAALGLQAGDRLPEIAPALRAGLDAGMRLAARHEDAWTSRLRQIGGLELPYPRRMAATPGLAPHRLPLPPLGAEAVATAAAALSAWLHRLCHQASVTLAMRDADSAEEPRRAPFFMESLPLTLRPDAASSAAACTAAVAEQLDSLFALGRFAADLPSRLPAGQGPANAGWQRIGLLRSPAPAAARLDGQEILLAVSPTGEAQLLVCAVAYAPEVAAAMARHFGWFLQNFTAGMAPAAIPLAPEEERAAILAANSSATPFAATTTVPAEIAAVVSAAPDRIALVGQDESLTYAELDRRAAALAARLAAAGAGPGGIVGLCLDRGPGLVVAVLAIQRAGAAYLPLDPAYPAERIAFMLADSKATILVTSEAVRRQHPLPCAHVLLVDDIAEAVPPVCPVPSPAGPDDLAYVIYTSGSTGKPKGVMVTHRNVLNFFAGMDARIPHDPPGVWLAVTSLSFDISVLELSWTLARGFTVVLHGDTSARRSRKPLDFSLFYFASDEAADAGDKYRLLIEGARFADEHGFSAVWTPERHFHAFGGQYPNPAVSSAAVAACTRRVAIRAGSVVVPLHHPVRVVEEWSMVDNLSNGRAGIAVASGWQPNDFLFAPDRFETRKQFMLESMESVRRLWRGESLSFLNAMGRSVEIRTMPRPVQKELPVWLTAAGNPETFIEAGRRGCGVLTHLLGQTPEEVAAKIAQYRAAWSAAGHAGEGHVVLMLHSFVGDDLEQVRDAVRQPMKNYLTSAMDLVRQAAWTFPTFVQRAAANGQTPADMLDAEGLSEADRDALLEHAFNRYFTTSGLFGTAESCQEMVARLRDIGVDEIGCLIDFGIPTDSVLKHLHHLHRLMQLANEADAPQRAIPVPELVLRHGVTHFQCTPSMAAMLVADGAGRTALGRLGTMMVGGEALPLSLARQLRAILPGKLLNMYGPTETTIWSSVQDLQEIGAFVPLGQPIANTALHVVDAAGSECPAYVAGELLIGGEGVTRGYLFRPELTAERFITAADGVRLYRTGDLVRRHPDGALEFLGRIDHQVKIRGHRIELGEIEAVLGGVAGVQHCVVIAREEAGDHRLLGYATPKPGATLDAAALRGALARALPEIMVPASILVMPSLPMTPNGKVDRAALPSHRGAAASAGAAVPRTAMEDSIAAIWCELLDLPEVDAGQNFFDLGGHSLLVVQVQRRLRDVLGREVPIVDMFRFPTVRGLATHLSAEPGAASAAAGRGMERARARQALLQRRQTAENRA